MTDRDLSTSPPPARRGEDDQCSPGTSGSHLCGCQNGADPVLTRLIRANPDLNAEELASAYQGCDEDPDVWPMPYHGYERHADEIVLAYLRLSGNEELDGTPGDHSEQSLDVLMQKTRMGQATIEDEPAYAALVPSRSWTNSSPSTY